MGSRIITRKFDRWWLTETAPGSFDLFKTTDKHGVSPFIVSLFISFSFFVSKRLDFVYFSRNKDFSKVRRK